MQKCCIYKLKKGKLTGYVDEYFSKYVVVEDFGTNPLENEGGTYCVYKHIFTETMEYTSKILGYCILPCNVFEEYFEFYMSASEINEKLMELEKAHNTRGE